MAVPSFQFARLSVLLCALGLSACAPLSANTVLVSHAKAHQIAVYHLAASTGSLSLTQTFPTGQGPGVMCWDHSGKTLYVSLRDDKAIAAYRWNESAPPSLLSTTPVDAFPGYLSVHPSGKYLLSSYYSTGRIAIHRINKNGSLAPQPTTSLSTDERAHAIVSDPSGRFIYVPHTRPNAIFQFAFDASTGMVEPLQPAKLVRTITAGPRHLWFHPTLNFAYGSDEQGNSITAYTHDPDTGTLKATQTRPSIPADFDESRRSTSDIEVHPSGRFAYIANRGHNSIASFAIDDTSGHLALLEHTPVEAVPRSFNITPDGQFLIAAGSQSKNLRVFRIHANGRLEPTQTVIGNEAPWWVVTRPHFLTEENRTKR